MSLRHGVLGLLAEGPASGYDLAQRFQQVLGAVWPAKHPRIHAELGRLADAGLIEVDSEGPRGRKAYRIVESGLDEVRDWLSHGEVDHTVRLQPLLRSFFFWLMDPEDPRRHLAPETQYFGDSAQTQSMRIAIEAGVRLYQALADWAAWAQTVPPLPEQPAVPAADA